MAELEERVEQVFSANEKLRELVGDGRARRELLDNLFRTVHSLKAMALANGLDNFSRIANDFENLLHSLRAGKVSFDSRMVAMFDDAAEALYTVLHPAAQNNERPRSSLEIAKMVPRRKRAEVDLVLNSLAPEIYYSLSEAEKHRLQESVGEGANLYLVSTNFDLSNFDQQYQGLKTRLQDIGEVISTAPQVASNDSQTIDFRIIYTSDLNPVALQHELISFRNVSVSEVVGSGEYPAVAEPSADQTRSVEKHSDVAYIRINLEDLDRLISQTYSLFRETTTWFDRAVDQSKADAHLELEGQASHLADEFIELAADMVNLRMVSIDRLLQRSLRAGRAAARAAGKEIDFIVRGRELMLDKSLSEAITDPVIHLVRNAVDHGIESAGERIAVGKSPKGTVRVEASTIQGQTRIVVTDDGKGVDPDAVLRTAVKLRLVPKDSSMGMDKSLRMIFRPGFSTAHEVSETSGRGVGLDVVESAIEDLGGAIRVASTFGIGSRFEIRLPVTFGLLDTIVVNAMGQRYLLDATHVVSSRRSGAAEVRTLMFERSVKIGDDDVPVHSLPELLGQPHFDNGAGGTLVLCELRRDDDERDDQLLNKFYLLVDEVGTEKVLVRNLGSRGARWFGVAGAAELRDGTVALLLDLPRLLEAVSLPVNS